MSGIFDIRYIARIFSLFMITSLQPRVSQKLLFLLFQIYQLPLIQLILISFLITYLFGFDSFKMLLAESLSNKSIFLSHYLHINFCMMLHQGCSWSSSLHLKYHFAIISHWSVQNQVLVNTLSFFQHSLQLIFL